MPKKHKNKSVKKTRIIVKQVSRPSKKKKSRRRKTKKRKSRGRGSGGGFTVAGNSFLKCVTSAPDFDMGACLGIPDEFSGKTVVKADYLTLPISLAPSLDAARQIDHYFVFAPTPGMAYWYTSIDYPIGGVLSPDLYNFNASPFPDTIQLFPYIFDTDSSVFISNTEQVSKFRYISMAAELQCMMNEFQWAGSIQVWKTPLDLTTTIPESGATDVVSQYITGFEGILNGSQNNAIGGFGSQIFSTQVKSGIYSQSMNRDPQFMFASIRDQVVSNSVTLAPAGSPGVDSKAVFKGALYGFGTLDCIVVKVSIPFGAGAQSFLLKSWCNIEYQTAHGALLEQFAHPSPGLDMRALQAYALLHNNLPLGVVQKQNADFWRRVLQVLRGGSGLLSNLPGSWGTIFKGVHAATNLGRR